MQQQPAVGKYFFLGTIFSSLIILADQYTKWLVIETMLRMDGPASAGFLDWFMTQKKIEFFVNEREAFKTIAIAPLLNFVMVWNQGISFGLFDTNSPNMSLVFVAISILASLLLIIWLALATKKMVAVPLMLIIGGALANVIDRIRFGAVADFIDVHMNSYHWPAFNLADSCIALGAGILIVETLFCSGGENGKAIK